MKKLIMLCMVFGLILGFSTGAFATIVGSEHDLSGAGLGTTELCIFCHIPHNPIAGINLPLWNRPETVSQGSFTLYDGTAAASVTGSSAICFSCHDGVTNLNAFQGGADDTPMGAVPGNLDLDLTDDHPVSMVYGTAGVGDGTEYQVAPLNGLVLEATNVECATCHDPHNPDNGSFLVIPNTNSDICTSCHMK